MSLMIFNKNEDDIYFFDIVKIFLLKKNLNIRDEKS